MSRVVELIAVLLLPTAAGYLLLGGFRLLRWAGDRRWRPAAAPGVTADERLAADLRRLRAELEPTEARTDLPAKRIRLGAVRAAYLDALAAACERLDVTPPPGGRRAPQTEIYRAEAALRQRGLDVRAPDYSGSARRRSR
jgi:hypothetical protein